MREINPHLTWPQPKCVHIKYIAIRETGDGLGTAGSNPAGEGAIFTQALLDTATEATIISENLYSRYKAPVNKLEATQKPVLGANNMTLDVVEKTEVTIQLGGIRARHKVLMGWGLPQQVLIGIEFWQLTNVL